MKRFIDLVHIKALVQYVTYLEYVLGATIISYRTTGDQVAITYDVRVSDDDLLDNS